MQKTQPQNHSEGPAGTLQSQVRTCSELCSSGSVLMACGCQARWCYLLEGCVGYSHRVMESMNPVYCTSGQPIMAILFWLPARWAFGFSGDHQQNIQCVLINRWYVLIQSLVSRALSLDVETKQWLYFTFLPRDVTMGVICEKALASSTDIHEVKLKMSRHYGD